LNKMKSEHHRKIHNILKKHHPDAVIKAKRLFKFKYPKLFLLLIIILFSYYLFSQTNISNWISNFKNLNYPGAFIAGTLLAIGFSAPIGLGFFISAIPQNILLLTLIGGAGAMFGDFIIFKTIKLSFMDEFKELEKSKAVHAIEKIVKKNKSVLIRHYLLYIFAGIVLATPLPDELGVSMLAGLTTIKPLKLAIISFLIHFTVIFFLLAL
jgi:uncharacterized membrane protein YdjX (TVP38/TMEM64 family)